MQWMTSDEIFGPNFYLHLSNILANKSRHHVCKVFMFGFAQQKIVLHHCWLMQSWCFSSLKYTRFDDTWDFNKMYIKCSIRYAHSLILCFCCGWIKTHHNSWLGRYGQHINKHCCQISLCCPSSRGSHPSHTWTTKITLKREIW